MRALRNAAFDPRQPGPLRVIADVGNADYYVSRAKEMLSDIHNGNRRQNLSNAMSLLALAQVTIDAAEEIIARH